MSVDSVDVTQPDPLITEIEKKIISCFGAKDGAFTVSTYGGTPDYTYAWSNGYTGPVQNMMSPGNYHLTITDQLGCFIDTSLKLIEPGQLVVNPTIRKPTCNDTKDGYIELNISGGRMPYSIFWDNGTIEENLYEIKSGIYSVMIHDSSMCSLDTSFKLIGVHDICIRIPNAFTPNGDSYNELWEIDMKGLYPQAEIEVFDRYGRRVFYSKGYDESQYWDGTHNGKELPMDSYYYVINLKNGSPRLSGTVTIIR
jgi:gliding motility-associated-like protein